MPKFISNPYPFKKIGFYPYPYPLSSHRIFLLFDRIGSGRKSMDTDTFAISKHHKPMSEYKRITITNQNSTLDHYEKNYGVIQIPKSETQRKHDEID